MSDKAAELAQFAQEYSSKNVDLYELLGVDALTPVDEIHRAWRKRSLKYHPDKAGDAFDADKWELFERARDILADPAARGVYEAAMKAVLLRKQEREAMDQQRKHFVDDLEAREGAWRRQQEDKQQREREAMDKERERLAGERRMRDDEARRQAEAEQEREDLAEARRRLKEKKEKKKQDEAREKFLKRARKAAAAAEDERDTMNGAVTVPGDYVVNLGTAKRKYWELVCDKLRAVQAVRDLQKRDSTTSEEYAVAQRGLREAKQRIHEAEVKFAEGVSAS